MCASASDVTCRDGANVIVGYAVAVATQLLVFPVGLTTTPFPDLGIGAVFTLVSLIRS